MPKTTTCCAARTLALQLVCVVMRCHGHTPRHMTPPTAAAAATIAGAHGITHGIDTPAMTLQAPTTPRRRHPPAATWRRVRQDDVTPCRKVARKAHQPMSSTPLTHTLLATSSVARHAMHPPHPRALFGWRRRRHGCNIKWFVPRDTTNQQMPLGIVHSWSG